MQTIDLERLDPYLASVSDQEAAMRDSDSFIARLVLRSQLSADRFWVLDAWRDRLAMETAAITMRTLASVAGLAERPREITTVQVPVGSSGVVLPGSDLRLTTDPLPFYLIAENHVKHVSIDPYIEAQDRFTRDLEDESGYGHRMLLRNLAEDTHFIVIDEWRSERHAYEAFDRRQDAITEVSITGYLSLLAERGKHDFALGIHG